MTKSDRHNRSGWFEFGLIAAASMAAMLVLSTIALVLYNNASRPPKIIAIEIPSGTSELVARGQDAIGIPDLWSFQAGDTLQMANRDVITHNVGGLVVLPGTTGEVVLLVGDEGEVETSLLPAGVVSIDVEVRHASAWLLLYPTVGFGLSIALVLWIGLIVMRALDKEPDVSEYLGPPNTDS